MPMQVKIVGQLELESTYPSKIVIPFSKGILKPEHIWKVVTIPLQLADPEIAATWPDGSVKILHLHTNIMAGTEYQVDVVESVEAAHNGLVVTENANSWFIDNGVYDLRLSKTTGDLNGAQSFLQDEREIPFVFSGDVEVAFSGKFLIVFKLDGGYIPTGDAAGRVDPFMKQTTYISIYYGSSIIKFAHASTFAANMNKHSIKLLGYECIGFGPINVRHEENKFPIRATGERFYQWISSGSLSSPDDLELAELYKFKYLADGPLLTTRFPNAYITAWDEQKDTTECKSSYARAGNMQGLSLYDEFCVGDEGENFLQDAVGLVINTETGIFGKINPAYVSPSEQCNELDDLAHTAIYGLTKSAERFGDYGQFIFGNAHHDELIVIDGGRPSLHRCWDNGHYQRCSIAWMLAFRSGNELLFEYARLATNYLSSLAMYRYDENPEKPETNFHLPGAFCHCKGVLPWGGRDYGMDANDVDADLIGHWPDPSSLLYSWLLDGNRWNRDGYKIWDTNVRVRLPIFQDSWAREANTTFVHALTLYQYTHDKTLIPILDKSLQSLILRPLKDQQPGPFWEPTWLARAYEYDPTNQALKDFIIVGAQDCLPQRESTWALSLAALAYELTHDITFLQDIIPVLQRIKLIPSRWDFGNVSWDNYNFKPGMLAGGDGHFAYQWPRVEDALHRAGILAWPDKWTEIGNYANGQTRFNERWDCLARGTQIIVEIPDPAPSYFDIKINAGTLAAGDTHATSLIVLDPDEIEVLNIPRLPMTGYPATRVVVFRDSSWAVNEEVYTIHSPKSGKYQIYVSSNELALCGPLTIYPEYQILQTKDKTGTNELQKYQFKISQMHLLRNTDKQVICTFIAHGVKNPACINGTFLKPGWTMVQNVTENIKLNIHCEGDAWVEILIDCEDRYPLLLSQLSVIEGAISY